MVNACHPKFVPLELDHGPPFQKEMLHHLFFFFGGGGGRPLKDLKSSLMQKLKDGIDQPVPMVPSTRETNSTSNK